VNFIPSSSLLVVARLSRKGHAMAALGACCPRRARTASRPSGLPLSPTTRTTPVPRQGDTNCVSLSCLYHFGERERPRHGRALAMAGTLRVRCPWPRSSALAAWHHPKRAHAGARGCVPRVCGKKGGWLAPFLAGRAAVAMPVVLTEETGRRAKRGSKAHRGVDGERVAGQGDLVQR
jgi:hypothetical protein